MLYICYENAYVRVTGDTDVRKLLKERALPVQPSKDNARVDIPVAGNAPQGWKSGCRALFPGGPQSAGYSIGTPNWRASRSHWLARRREGGDLCILAKSLNTGFFAGRRTPVVFRHFARNQRHIRVRQSGLPLLAYKMRLERPCLGRQVGRQAGRRVEEHLRRLGRFLGARRPISRTVPRRRFALDISVGRLLERWNGTRRRSFLVLKGATCYVRDPLHDSLSEQKKIPIYEELLNRASRRRFAVSRAA